MNDKQLGGQNVAADATEIPFGPDLGEHWPLVGPTQLSTVEVELLKYYSHHIAPWVSNNQFLTDITVLTLAWLCLLARYIRSRPHIRTTCHQASNDLTLRT